MVTLPLTSSLSSPNPLSPPLPPKLPKVETRVLTFAATPSPSPAPDTLSRIRSLAPVAMDAPQAAKPGAASAMKLLFVEMGVGYDQHGQDITKAAMKACRDAIGSNSIPAFRIGSVPGVDSDQMKLLIKLAVPQCTQHLLDIEKVKSIFPYGQILDVEVMDGGMICSSGVLLEAMGDQSEDCYVVNAAVYVGY